MQHVSRVCENTLWQIAPPPPPPRLVPASSQDVDNSISWMEQNLLVFCHQLNRYFLCQFHIKCFYSSKEGDICMVWMRTRVVSQVFHVPPFILIISSVFALCCHDVWQGWTWVFYFSLHEMQLTKWALLIWTLCPRVFLFVNPWLVFNHLYVGVFSV